MSGFGLPDFKGAKDILSGAGTTNANTRDLSAPNVVKMQIIPVNEPYNRENVVLLNPNSITETKSANWVKHYIPGQSDPLLQWVNGSERVITFTAFVTKDIASNPTVNAARNGSTWELIIQPELNEKLAVAQDYNALALSSLATDTYVNDVEAGGRTSPQWSRSIQPQLDYYRSLVLPREGASAAFPKNPPLVQLKMGTVLGDSESTQDQKYILLNYNMNITEFSPQLEPTKASVTFTFIEYVARSKSEPAQVRQGSTANLPTIDNGTLNRLDLNRLG